MGGSRFEEDVLEVIPEGNPKAKSRMPGCFALAQPGGILSPEWGVKIYISTPVDGTTNRELYENKVDKIVEMLTGANRPWARTTPVRRTYVKPASLPP